MRTLISYLGIFTGSIIFAVGINYFIIANKLAEGGLTGIALIIHYLSGWPAGTILFLLNAPLLLFSWQRWGIAFVFRTVLSIFIISLTIDLTRNFGLQTGDLLLAALYGGSLSGVGIGLVLRSGATTGGVDIIARYIHQRYGYRMGNTYLLIDLIVLIIFALIFGLEKALYTLVAVYIFSQVVDRMVEGFNEAKAVTIISSKTPDIVKTVLDKLDRGATFFRGHGAFTGEEKNVLYVVISKYQLLRLKKIVKERDPDAFVIVNNVHEVLGEGFQKKQIP